MLHFNKLTDFLPSTTGQFQHSLFGRNCVAAGANYLRKTLTTNVDPSTARVMVFGMEMVSDHANVIFIQYFSK